MHIMLLFCGGLGLEHALSLWISFLDAYYIKLVMWLGGSVSFFKNKCIPYVVASSYCRMLKIIIAIMSYNIYQITGPGVFFHIPNTVQTLHFASYFCFLTSRIHWKAAGLNPLTPSALPLWCRYGTWVGFTTGLPLVTCHDNGRSANNFKQCVWSRGCVCVCVCVVDVFFCMVRTEWTKLSDCISPIHETSDNRYVVMVFVGRFDFYFIILLLLIGE